MQSWIESNILLSLTDMHPFQNYKIKYIYAGKVVGEGKEGEVLVGCWYFLFQLVEVDWHLWIPSPNERMKNPMKKKPKVSLISLKKLRDHNCLVPQVVIKDIEKYWNLSKLTLYI